MSFLKKHWETIIIGLMAIGILLSVKTCQKNADTIRTLENKTDSAYTSVRYYKDKNERLQAQVNAQEVTIENFKGYWAEDSKRIKKQIGNLNRLIAFWKGKAGVVDSVYIEVTDTVYLTREGFDTNKGFNYSNGYLTLSGGLNTITNQLSLDYQYQVNFELTSYYKKTGLFKKQLVADLNFSDPKLKVQEFDAIQIKPKERFYDKAWFQIGVGVIGGFYLGSKL